MATAITFDVDDVPSLSEIRSAQLTLDAAHPDRHHLKLNSDGYLVSEKGHNYLPDTRHLRLRICIVAHQGRAGHRSYDTTLQWIRQHFYWPTMQTDVRQFATTCISCVKTKGGKVMPRPYLHAFHATEPNAAIHFDYMYIRAPTPGTPAQHQYVLVIMDCFSKFTELIPSPSADAETAVTALLAWFQRFGPVNRWTSDRGTHFINTVITKLATVLRANHHFTASYAPWSNGIVERRNRDIREIMSAIMLDNDIDDEQWPTILPVVNAVLNNTPTPTLGGHAPITVFTGHPPFNPLDIIFSPAIKDLVPTVPTAQHIIDSVVTMQQRLHDATEAVQHTPQRKLKQRGTAIDFTVGDYVLTARRAKLRDKTRPIWEGPAVVLEQLNDRVYRVQDLGSDYIQELHAEFIKRYADMTLTVTPQLRQFAAAGGRGEIIDHIDSHRLNPKTRRWEVLVRWQAYDDEEPTWQPLDRIKADAPTVVNSYIRTIKSPEDRRTLEKALATPNAKSKR